MWEVHFAIRGLDTKVHTFRSHTEAIEYADAAARGAHAIAWDTPWLRNGIAVHVRKSRASNA